VPENFAFQGNSTWPQITLSKKKKVNQNLTSDVMVTAIYLLPISKANLLK